MEDILKKAILFGVGVTTLSKDKAKSIVNDLRKKGYLNVKEGQKMVNDLLKQSAQTQKKVQEMVKEQIDKTLKMMPLATKKDLQDLEKKCTCKTVKKKK